MDFWIFAVLILVSAVVAGLLGDKENKNKKVMDDRLGRLKDFSATQKFVGLDGKSGLAIDERREKICLIYHWRQNVTARVISYMDLLASEIFEDGVTVTKTVRSSQIGGALIGGVALGGVGAIIGGLSGSKQTSDKVRKIDLRLTVNNTTNPIHDVNFLNLPTKKNSILYKQAIQNARHWQGLIEVLIKRAEREDKTTNTDEPARLPLNSIADELKKLADLRDAGVLSTEEFQLQKSRLLGL